MKPTTRVPTSSTASGKMVDIKAYEFSKIWLSAGGWTHDLDVMKLAQLVQDISEEFVSELEADYETSTHADTH